MAEGKMASILIHSQLPTPFAYFIDQSRDFSNKDTPLSPQYLQHIKTLFIS